MLAHVAVGGGVGGGGPQAGLHPDAEVPLNLKAEESPTSPCPGATMADGYDPAADPAQTRHFMDVDEDGDDDQDDNVDRDRDREKDVAGHLPHLHRQHPLMSQFQGLHSFQSLQGLHSFHRAQPNQPQPPPPPLNLSLSVTGSGALTGAAERRSLAPPPPPPSMAPLPQLILASGRLVPGLQVTQLLVPTPQGVASQTVLAIPVSHVAPGQIVNLALADGQVICTTLGQLLQCPESISPSLRRRPSGAGAALPNSPPPQPPLSSAHLSNGIASSINRLAANNCDLTITPTTPPPPPRPPRLASPSAQPPAPSMPLPPRSSPSAQQPTPCMPLPPKSSSPSSPSSPASASASPRGHGSPHSPDSDFLDDGEQQSPARGRPRSPWLVGARGIPTIAVKAGEWNEGVPLPLAFLDCCGKDAAVASEHPRAAKAIVTALVQGLQASTNMVDGINLDEIKEFAKAFKLRRLSLGLTQTQVGQALSVTEGPAYSQSAICRYKVAPSNDYEALTKIYKPATKGNAVCLAVQKIFALEDSEIAKSGNTAALATQMICAAQIANQRQSVFEKLDITPKSAQKIKPVLEHWMKEAEERYKIGQNHLTEFIGMEPSKKRKRRTSFTPQALELLNAHFERNTHPSGTEITALAHQLGYDREVIRIWFCNKRQALKNTVRMMSKGLGVT